MILLKIMYKNGKKPMHLLKYNKPESKAELILSRKNNSLVNHKVNIELSCAQQGASHRKAEPAVTVKYNHYRVGIKLRWRLMTFSTL